MSFANSWLTMPAKKRAALLVEAGHSPNLKTCDFSALDWRVKADLEFCFNRKNAVIARPVDFSFIGGQIVL